MDIHDDGSVEWADEQVKLQIAQAHAQANAAKPSAEQQRNLYDPFAAQRIERDQSNREKALSLAVKAMDYHEPGESVLVRAKAFLAFLNGEEPKP